jgi:hypothetical protein
VRIVEHAPAVLERRAVRRLGITGTTAIAPTARDRKGRENERNQPTHVPVTVLPNRERERAANCDTIAAVSNDSPIPPKVEALYSDRNSGVTYENAFDMVNAYIARYAEQESCAIEPLDGTGYTQVKRGSAYIGINVLEDNGVLMLLAPIMEVPPASAERFYRKLLELSFLATADASFAIDGKKDLVYVRALRRVSALDFEEFEDLIRTVSQVADEWDDALKAEFS